MPQLTHREQSGLPGFPYPFEQGTLACSTLIETWAFLVSVQGSRLLGAASLHPCARGAAALPRRHVRVWERTGVCCAWSHGDT